jgi:hypothetical protein
VDVDQLEAARSITLTVSVQNLRTTAAQCNKLDGSTLLTCRYETDRTGGDRDRLAHNSKVEPRPVRDIVDCILASDVFTTLSACVNPRISGSNRYCWPSLVGYWV